jgi:hypothetical protein
MRAGDASGGTGEWGMGNREWGMGSRECGMEKNLPSAFRIPHSLLPTPYSPRYDQNNFSCGGFTPFNRR